MRRGYARARPGHAASPLSPRRRRGGVFRRRRRRRRRRVRARILQVRDDVATARDDPRLPSPIGALADRQLDADRVLHELEVGSELGDRHRRHRAADLGLGHRGRDGPKGGDADGEPDGRVVVHGAMPTRSGRSSRVVGHPCPRLVKGRPRSPEHPASPLTCRIDASFLTWSAPTPAGTQPCPEPCGRERASLRRRDVTETEVAGQRPPLEPQPRARPGGRPYHR